MKDETKNQFRVADRNSTLLRFITRHVQHHEQGISGIYTTTIFMFLRILKIINAPITSGGLLWAW